MEYHPALQMREILPAVTAWRNLVGIMLSEVNQTEKGEYRTISHAESKKVKCIDTALKGGCQGPDSEGSGETLVKGNKLSVTSGVSSGALRHSMVAVVYSAVLYTCNLLRVHRKVPTATTRKVTV